MITRLTLPIDILHDERIVALVADCGPQSIAVLISLLAILRRRDEIPRDRYLIAKIRHDLSLTLDEGAINAVIDHLIESGYLVMGEALMVRQAAGRRGNLAPSGNAGSSCNAASPYISRGGGDAPSSPMPDDAPSSPTPIPGFDNYEDPFSSGVWPHRGPYTLEEVIGAYRCRYVQRSLVELRETILEAKGLELNITEELAVNYYKQFSDSWIEHGYPVINLGKSLAEWIGKTALREARQRAKAKTAQS